MDMVKEMYRYVDDQLSAIYRVRWKCWDYEFLNGMVLRFDFDRRVRFVIVSPERDIVGVTDDDVIDFVIEYDRRKWARKKVNVSVDKPT